MQAAIPMEVMRRAFSAAKSFVPSRTTCDAFRYVKMQYDTGEFTLIGSDGESSVRVKSKGIVCDESGELMLPADKFSMILSESLAGGVTIQNPSKSELLIEEADNEFRLLTINPESFPKVVDPEGAASVVSIPASMLCSAIGSVLCAVAEDDQRYTMNGVRLEAKLGEIAFIGTDSRRMAVNSYPVNLADGCEVETIIPSKDCKRLVNAASNMKDGGNVVLSKYPSQLMLDVDSTTIILREGQGRFPDWRRVFPKQTGEPIVTQAGHLASIIRQAKLGRETDDTAVVFRFGCGSLSLSTDGKKPGCKIQLPISYDGKEIEVRLNPDYVLAWVAKIPASESIEWYVTNGESPVLMVSGNSRYVIMPLTKEE